MIEEKAVNLKVGSWSLPSPSNHGFFALRNSTVDDSAIDDTISGSYMR